MATLVGVGSSDRKNPVEAGSEAALKALERAGISKPDFVFAFATVGYNQEALLRSIREATSGAPLSGCSGEGVITQEMASETNFGVCVMVISSDELRFSNACIKDIGDPAETAGERLAHEISPFLASDSIAFFLMADGLVFNFDSFLAGFEKTLNRESALPIYGGLASDNWVSRRTFQYHDDEAFSEGISCVVMSGNGNVACRNPAHHNPQQGKYHIRDRWSSGLGSLEGLFSRRLGAPVEQDFPEPLSWVQDTGVHQKRV